MDLTWSLSSNLSAENILRAPFVFFKSRVLCFGNFTYIVLWIWPKKQESCVFLAERQELKCWPRPKTSHTAPLQHSFSSSVNIPILLLSIIIFCCPQNSASQIIGISHHHRRLAAWSEDFNPFEIKGGEVGLGQMKSSKSPSLKPFLTSSFWNIIEKQYEGKGSRKGGGGRRGD